MYTHELGLTQKPLQPKTKQNPGTGEEGGGGGRQQGWGRRKASRAAAARRGPEPRPRDSEPDLIGVWRRELERGGHGAGGSGRPGAPSPAREDTEQPRRPPNGPPRLPPGPGSRSPSPGPARGPQRLLGRLSLRRPPSSPPPPPPPRPGRHSLREGGAARACASLTSTCCVTAPDADVPGGPSPRNAWPRPYRPVERGGRHRAGGGGGFGAAAGARTRAPWAGAASRGRTEHYQDWKGRGPRAPSSRQPSAPTGLRHRTAVPTANSEKTGSVARDT